MNNSPESTLTSPRDVVEYLGLAAVVKFYIRLLQMICPRASSVENIGYGGVRPRP